MLTTEAPLERIAEGALFKRGHTDTLVIAFCSMLVPRLRDFEFEGVARSEPHSFLIVRDDTGRLYYHAGIAGLGQSIPACRDAMAEICADVRPRKLVTVGASMGGYAALLYGCLLGADVAISVNGLSFVDEGLAEFWGGGERGEHTMRDIARLYAARGTPAQFTDLRKVAENLPMPMPKTRWHFSTGNTVDVLHAAHLGGLNNIDFVAYRNRKRHAQLGKDLLRTSILSREINGQWSPASDRRHAIAAADIDPLVGWPNTAPSRAAWEWAQ